ncbi:MAG TPA: flavodoxin [Candidatus Moranbacteria bacterium]|nr:flavodoxin [Candidatus Moranbacteria bacterium]HRZ33412.1 flavodoxin [Candidatus Moranbacteria bacterium]
MKILIIYYSRTGTTKKIALAVAKRIGAEVEEIKDTINRDGIKGYLISGRDAMQKKLTILKQSLKNPAEFDLVIIGTPIWAWSISAPVRTYITEKKNSFKKIAIFCTMGGSGDVKVFSEIAEIIGLKPIATLALLTKDVARDKFIEKLEKFIAKI